MRVLTQGQIGAILRAEFTQDGDDYSVAGATTKNIVILKPDGTVLTKTASYSDGTGANGKIQYSTASGDLDLSGPYQFQGHVILAGGDDFRSLLTDFYVEGTI